LLTGVVACGNGGGGPSKEGEGGGLVVFIRSIKEHNGKGTAPKTPAKSDIKGWRHRGQASIGAHGRKGRGKEIEDDGRKRRQKTQERGDKKRSKKKPAKPVPKKLEERGGGICRTTGRAKGAISIGLCRHTLDENIEEGGDVERKNRSGHHSSNEARVVIHIGEKKKGELTWRKTGVRRDRFKKGSFKNFTAQTRAMAERLGVS